MERYFYERGALQTEADIIVELDDGDVTETGWMQIDGFMIFDRLRGHVDDRSLAFCLDEADAGTIIAALNATVRNDG